MLKFAEYIIEASTKGADTAFSGHANEHFTHNLLKKYIEHYGNSAKKGLDDQAAHNSAMEHIASRNYDPKEYSTVPELQNAAAHFGQDEMSRMHDDSKKTVGAILNHLRNNYNSNIADSMHVGKGGPKAVEKETGKKSEADLLLKTRNSKGQTDQAKAYLEHVGASLKYSKGAASNIKIHSPTVNKMAQIVDDHHQQMHGTSSGIHEELDRIGKEGVAAQQAALAKHHNVLANYFNSLNDPKLTYTPNVDQHGNITGGNLSQEAVSHLRDADKKKDPQLRAAYDDMAKENLKMKTKMAEAFHNSVSSVLDYEPGNPNHSAIKESLLRGMGNMQKDKLPTFLVSTERGKPEASVYDVGDYFTKHLAKNGVEGHGYTGKSTFKVGPMDISLDTRPTTSKNPVTSFPINTTVKSSDMKKEGPTDVKPKRVNKKIPKLSQQKSMIGHNNPPSSIEDEDPRISAMAGEGGGSEPRRLSHDSQHGPYDFYNKNEKNDIRGNQ